MVSHSTSSLDQCEQILNNTNYKSKLKNIRKTQQIDFTPVYEVEDSHVLYLFKAVGEDIYVGEFIAIEVNIRNSQCC